MIQNLFIDLAEKLKVKTESVDSFSHQPGQVVSRRCKDFLLLESRGRYLLEHKEANVVPLPDFVQFDDVRVVLQETQAAGLVELSW